MVNEIFTNNKTNTTEETISNEMIIVNQNETFEKPRNNQNGILDSIIIRVESPPKPTEIGKEEDERRNYLYSDLIHSFLES